MCDGSVTIMGIIKECKAKVFILITNQGEYWSVFYLLPSGNSTVSKQSLVSTIFPSRSQEVKGGFKGFSALTGIFWRQNALGTKGILSTVFSLTTTNSSSFLCKPMSLFLTDTIVLQKTGSSAS